jgi:glycosyltransferase involved in cell wall biosynthesis
MNPRISIITVSLNAASTIERAIQSVLAQGYKHIEHIIVDGGSTDSTPEIVRKYPHIKFSWEKDQGQSDAMNKGFDNSTGELIVYLNADDEFAPGVFDKVIKAYERTNRSGKFMLVMDLLIEESGGLHWTAVPSLTFSDISDPGKMLFPFNPLSYFYHRHVQEVVGKFPIELKYAMDYYFLLRAYKLAEMLYEPFVAGTFYNFDNKTREKKSSELQGLQVLISYYKKKMPFVFVFHPNVIKAKRIMGQLNKGI